MHLIVLPGMDGTLGLLAPFLDAAGESMVVSALAYPTDRALDYDGLLSWVRARLPRSGCFVILAESFSRPIGLRLAADPPPGMCALILCCSFASSPLRLPTWLAALPFWHLPVALVAPFVFGRWARPGNLAAFAVALQQVSPSAWRVRLRSVLAVDVRDCLTAIALPVLYLRGDRDRLVGGAKSREIAARLADYREQVFPAPHFLLQTLPKQAALACKEFVDELR